MSFINLLANDVWSEADITRRTEAMVRQHFTSTQETVLNRKITGASLGQYVLTNEDKVELAKFQSVLAEAQKAGEEARADMELLHEVFQVEPCVLRLRMPLVELPEEPTQEETNAYNQDQVERQEAEAVVASSDNRVLDLVELRNPLPEPEPAGEQSDV